MTADDERRAEIEAVARALHEQGFGFDIDADPVARESMFSVARVVLDRVRDARGDDEARACCGGDPSLPHIAGCPEIARERIAQSPQGDGEAHTKGCIQGEIDSECPCEARSPQGEDHEAGSFTIRWDDSMGCYRVSIPNYEGGEVVPIEVHRAALARVSPSRDGTVAVEDAVEALRDLCRWAESARGHYGIEECAGPGKPATEWDEVQDGLRFAAMRGRHALAGFARPATGEQTDHGG